MYDRVSDIKSKIITIDGVTYDLSKPTNDPLMEVINAFLINPIVKVENKEQTIKIDGILQRMNKQEKNIAVVGAGIFGDVETLRDFGEKALNQTVDKSMTDLTFIAALARAGKPIENHSIETLKKLQELHEQGLISDEEYSINKQKALDSM